MYCTVLADSMLAVDLGVLKSEFHSNCFCLVTAVACVFQGHLVWAQLGSHHWWPAMIISAVDCGKASSKPDRCWVFWFGDHKISEVLNYVFFIDYTILDVIIFDSMCTSLVSS